MVKYVLSSPWDSEKRNFDLFVCLVHVKKLTIKLTLTLTLMIQSFELFSVTGSIECKRRDFPEWLFFSLYDNASPDTEI